MERDLNETEKDVDEERSGTSEGEEAEESECEFSEVEEDNESKNNNEVKVVEVGDAKGDDDDDASDSNSTVSSDKQEEQSDEIESDESGQIQALQGKAMPEAADSDERVAEESSSDSEHVSALVDIAVGKQNRLEVGVETCSRPLQEKELHEDASVHVSLHADKRYDSLPAENLDKFTSSESAGAVESSSNLPNLEVLSVSETKSEFARHPDSTPKQLSQRVDDQEAELDFEEEVSIDRKEEREEEEERRQEDEDNDNEESKSNDDAEDDGEVDDDDDLEEGEVKDPVSSPRKPHHGPICRFFMKGHCTWGTACRFIHPGISDKGNYNMFAPTRPLVPNNGPIGGGVGFPLGPSRGHTGYVGRVPAEILIQPPPVEVVPAVESAWERGLRQAKENLKKANKRKETEPDFEEKRFNLSIAAEPEVEKENDYFSHSPFRKTSDPYQAYGYEDHPDPIYRQAQEYWRGGNYENFEVRYLRNDYESYKERDKDDKEKSRREKSTRYENVRSQDRSGGGRGGLRDSRYTETQGASRSRAADEWKDPWRRSTSPKRRGRSKSSSSAASGTSYSSASSRSRSSSFSSRSRSLSGTSSSSRNSRPYSRSRSRTRPSPHQRNTVASSSSNVPRKKQLPAHPPAQKSQMTPVKTSRPSPVKRPTTSRSAPVVATSLLPELKQKRQPPSSLQKPPPTEKRPSLPVRPKRPRSPILSGSDSDSSRSRSSRSSFSRSTSRSSISSRSSSRSSSVSSISDLDRSTNGVKKKEKLAKHAQQRKLKGRIHPQSKAGGATGASKDPLKQSGQKPQIKLTLLSKAKPQLEKLGISPLVQKEVGTDAKIKLVQTKDPKLVPKLTPPAVSVGNQPKPIKPIPPPVSKPEIKQGQPVKPPAAVVSMEPPKSHKPTLSTSGINRKRAAPSPSPTVSPVSQSKGIPVVLPPQPPQSPPPPPPLAKKSTLSRREELLKQLKAVEDAIARKRSKLT